jgi:23S rRNA (uracil1939-C5)-methyltransferase
VHPYRSKVEFSFQDHALGFHGRGRFDHFIEVDRCYLTPDPHAEVLRRTREWAARFQLDGWNPRRQTGRLRYLVFRRATSGDWLAVLVGSPGLAPEALKEWAAALQDLGPRALLWATQTSTACAIKPDTQELLYGTPFLRESLGALQFQLSWQSFFQSNPPAYLRLLETAKAWCALGPEARVLDLFCGIGTIGLYLTPPGGQLVGVESVPEAVEDARQAAALNARQGQFHCYTSQDWPDLDCDLLILDPPRSGCHPKLIERLLTAGPPRILYVSCNPHLWLTEAEQLLGPYRIIQAQPFDFFPHTRHVELLALLERR